MDLAFDHLRCVACGGDIEGIVKTGNVYDPLAAFVPDVDIELVVDAVGGPPLVDGRSI